MTGSHEAMDSSSSVISPEKNGYIEDPRLGRRLAYLLRYGAEKEGLQVQESGEDLDTITPLPADHDCSCF